MPPPDVPDIQGLLEGFEVEGSGHLKVRREVGVMTRREKSSGGRTVDIYYNYRRHRNFSIYGSESLQPHMLSTVVEGRGLQGT